MGSPLIDEELGHWSGNSHFSGAIFDTFIGSVSILSLVVVIENCAVT